MVNKASRTKI